MGSRKADKEVFMHFSITGADLTSLARERMLSEIPSDAFNFLKEVLNGPPGQAEHYAPKILDGEMCLTGNECDMRCADDPESEDYRQELRHIYAGRVRIDGAWFRPVARLVTGPGDSRDPDPKKYMNDGWIAVRMPPDESSEKGIRMLFEPIGEPPFWWPTIKTPAEAFVAFEAAGRRLELISTDARLARDEENEVAARLRREGVPAYEDDGEDDEKEGKRSALWAAEITRVREGVLAQAGDDLISLTLDDGTVVSNVARAPFLHWALERTPVKHLVPHWKPVSESGMKLAYDNPFHTDWLLGAGLSISKDAYGSPAAEAAYKLAFQYVSQLTEYDAVVLSEGAGTYLAGVVGEEILILRDLHPSQLDKVLAAKAVITEIGGALAHLAVVARESGIPILLVPDAVAKYPPGTYLQIHPKEGSIRFERNPKDA